MPNDYRRADKLIKGLANIKQSIQERSGARSNEFWSDLWTVIKQTGDIWKKSRNLNALPSDYFQVDTLMKNGGTAMIDYNRSIRDISYLEENGQCMDNIKPGKSENPDAGRGALANRFIPKGGLVAPAPMIHIELDRLKMFRPIDNWRDAKGGLIPDRDGPMHFQLILNYCFGQEKSTVLLCPYGLLTAFINHSAEAPNTKIQWSKSMRHPEWLEQPFESWAEEYHTGFQIDFVALRDIQENEEILIDYGEAWERSWQEHVRNYVPRENYIPAYELNEMDPDDVVYRTVDDRPYELDGIQLWCHGWYLKQFANNTKIDKDFGKDRLCEVLKRLGDDRYMVQTIVETDKDDKTTLEKKRVFWNLPSDAMNFADMHYERDHLQFSAFRHAMMIPEEMFPEVWKNLK